MWCHTIFPFSFVFCIKSFYCKRLLNYITLYKFFISFFKTFNEESVCGVENCVYLKTFLSQVFLSQNGPPSCLPTSSSLIVGNKLKSQIICQKVTQKLQRLQSITFCFGQSFYIFKSLYPFYEEYMLILWL